MPIVGVDGTVAKVIDDETLEALEVLKLFVDVAVKVYAVPFVSPETIIGDDVPVAVIEPGDDNTVYEFANPPPAPGVTGTDAEDVAAYVKAELY